MVKPFELQAALSRVQLVCGVGVPTHLGKYRNMTVNVLGNKYIGIVCRDCFVCA